MVLRAPLRFFEFAAVRTLLDMPYSADSLECSFRLLDDFGGPMSLRVAVFSVALLLPRLLFGDGTFQTVALSGRQALEAPAGTTYSTFDLQSLGSNGAVVFRAVLVSPTKVQSSELLTYHSGTLAVAAKTGNVAPGTPSGVTFNTFFFPVIDGAGKIAFGASMIGSASTSDDGLWTNSNGTLQLIGRTGDVLPGYSSSNPLRYFDRPAVSDDGTLVFKSFAVGNPESDEAVWSYRNGAISMLAREGAPSPVAGKVYSSFGDPTINLSGYIEYTSQLTDDSRNIGGGIWVQRPDGTTYTQSTLYSPAPGFPAGLLLAAHPGTINATGQIAFEGQIKSDTDTTVNSTNDDFIWSDRSGALVPIIREGTVAPGALDGAVFRNLETPPAFNDSGRIAFASGLNGPTINSTNSFGIWESDISGVTRLVVRAGAPVPGMPGFTFSEIGGPIMNNAGQIVFQSLLGSSTVGDIASIWEADANGALTMIARTGQQMDVDDGPGVDLRTIRSLQLIPRGTDLRPFVFNDRGQFVFWADFTDNSSGLFLSAGTSVPEPISGVLAVIGVTGLLTIRRRSRNA